jgi:tetratricopeptide (TPR) repeat protein
MPKTSPASWKTYEQQVFQLFREHYPNANVQTNAHVKGRYSKRKRQIDVLITEETPAGALKTVIDSKFFKRKVDVKSVDAFAGFVDDVGAQRGMLVTSRGYTQAALRRAFYGPSDLELDILDFSELQQFQGFTAIPYKGRNAFLVRAPLGWIVDAARTEGRVANMYRRGLNVEAAIEKKEFLYINFWDRKADPLTAEQLDEQQVAWMRLGSLVSVSHRPTIQRADAVTRLRIADVRKYGCLEVTGFLEFKDLIFFAVLLTPKETQRSNIRRLESVMRQALPVEMKRDNTALITKIREQLEQNLPRQERARLLREAGYWYRDMDQLSEARDVLEESLSIAPDGTDAYHTMNELLPVLRGLRDSKRAKEVTTHLLRVDPSNPTVFNDCFEYAAGWIERRDMLDIIDALRMEHATDGLIQANCDLYAGNILAVDNPASARHRFCAARRVFRELLPGNHQVFRMLRLALKQRH